MPPASRAACPPPGRISNGAIVEKDTGFKLASLTNLKLSLHNPDLTTATRIAKAVNAYLGGSIAQATDPSNVALTVPANYPGGVMALLTDIEQVKVDPDQPAKVVIDENSGVIVMGADVRISTVAIAQGNLTIKVTETPQVSQPSPFSKTGTTQIVPRTNIQIDDGKGNKIAVLQDGVSLQHLVDGLECAGRRPARHHLHPAGDQGGRRAAGRHPGDRLMDAAIQGADDDGPARRRWPLRPSRRPMKPRPTRPPRNTKASSSPSSWAACSPASRPTA